MKIKNIYIPIIVAVIVIALINSGTAGFNLMSLFSIILTWGLIIGIPLYLLVLVDRYVEAKVSETKDTKAMYTEVVLLKVQVEQMEKKIDRITEIMETAS